MCNAGNLEYVSKCKHCILCAISGKQEAKVVKTVLTTWCGIKHDHYTIDRDLYGICGHSPDV